MKLNNIKSILFGSTHYTTFFLIAISIIFIFTIFKPSLNAIREISQTIEKERYELEKLYTRGQVVHDVKIKLEDAKKDLPILEATVLKRGTELDWIKKIERIASFHNLKQKLDLGSSREEGDVAVLPFNMELKGDYRDILSYLRDLEKLEGYINILSFEVVAQTDKDSQEGSQEGGVAAFLKIDTFWQKP